MAWPPGSNQMPYASPYPPLPPPPAGQQPPPPPPDVEAAMYHFRGNSYNTPSNGSRPRPPRTFNFKMAERPLLTSQRNSPERLTLRSDNAKEKYRDLNELSDSDETDMELSEREVENQRPSKRVRIETDDPSTPKWSNPDPYTSLPPPDESSKKKKDVVKLIRKARNTGSSTQESSLDVAKNEDFISFDDLDADGRWNDESALPPPNAPSGPRNNRRAYDEQKRPKRQGAQESNQSRLISRRRPCQYSDDMVLREWATTVDCDPTPWLKAHQEVNISPGVKLHKEILDFYDWIRPRDFEEAVRAEVFNRLQYELNRLEQGELKAFGSYAAGLYLPTGDMDLVYFLRNFRPNKRTANGLPPKVGYHTLQKFASFLRSQRIAQPGSVLIISGAKVPIIKFVESISGLKVDLCFNNDTGIAANSTFQTWKTRYPTMPIIVSVIKHFLMIRGLNDVSIGGLGGFSVICLVTSLIQHFPIRQQPANLGQLLLEFFNLYGNFFNRDEVAIRLDPPGYIEKATYVHFDWKKEKRGRLTIVDPNRPENNISGGTHEIEQIVDCFSMAHQSLEAQMDEYLQEGGTSSFLESLVGGDFTAYTAQRNLLHDIHFGPDGQQAPAIIPPPPPPIDSTNSTRRPLLSPRSRASRR